MRMFLVRTVDGAVVDDGPSENGHRGPTSFFKLVGRMRPKHVVAPSGFPFKQFYLTHGDLTNGYAVAWESQHREI